MSKKISSVLNSIKLYIEELNHRRLKRQGYELGEWR
jgi:hypothetical protein